MPKKELIRKMSKEQRNTESQQTYKTLLNLTQNQRTQIKTIKLFFRLADWQRLEQTDVTMCW